MNPSFFEDFFLSHITDFAYGFPAVTVESALVPSVGCALGCPVPGPLEGHTHTRLPVLALFLSLCLCTENSGLYMDPRFSSAATGLLWAVPCCLCEKPGFYLFV